MRTASCPTKSKTKPFPSLFKVQTPSQYKFIYEAFAMLSKKELQEVELSSPKALASKLE